eukprot:1337307-Alexandrium_andersonii.AAC.1
MATHARHVAKSSKEGEGKFDRRLPGNCVSHEELGIAVSLWAAARAALRMAALERDRPTKVLASTETRKVTNQVVYDTPLQEGGILVGRYFGFRAL